ncbi:MAG: serine/threonine protein phosphatase [Deltaproteobacteria bacterium]|nr:serine/threonine protein phosphatase [Deltaproteobacteria bacterium]MBW2015320.1 serine/threonine protein phosphatase [Deltaproteobacteria bacterium]MBW2128181.1 serine/threonine protein phosphatase [Deltaproteobacteria bacterium]MBW2303102.1 serine/threonine protein phosphatase [Deltaproteobacteria bacterium]
MGKGKTFIVGDIHGCLGMLQRLIEKIPWEPERDRLIFLGDYVDRGEDPKGVIDFILRLQAVSEKVQCLMGNHEHIFLDYLERGNITAFLINGGNSTLESYRRASIQGKQELEIPPDHVSFLKALLPWIELEDHYVVHAGFRPGIPLEKQDLEDLIWIREPFIYSDYDFGKRVIFGHTPFSEPLVTDSKIGLDTGAVYGNKLTCLELPGLKFHFVEA